MTVKLLDGGRYKVDIRPRGATGRRIQRIFNKKADAVAFEKYVISNMHDKDWLDKPTDHRRLSELLDRWWELHGRSHKYGEKRQRELKRVIIWATLAFQKSIRGLLLSTEASAFMKGLRLPLLTAT